MIYPFEERDWKTWWIFWILSTVFMWIANYFWTLHDWYFWDQVTHLWIIDKYGGWHWVKNYFIIAVFASALFVENRWYNWICWIGFRWAAWEYWCHHASMSKPYEASEWAGGVFHLNKTIALIVCILFMILPYFLRKLTHRSRSLP